MDRHVPQVPCEDRTWHEADISDPPLYVRFVPQADVALQMGCTE
jgi:hypothetical protein